MKDYYRERYLQKIQSGLCVECGNIKDCSTVACTECKLKRREYQQKHYNERINAGLCVQCGIIKEEGTGRYCTSCNLKRRESRRLSQERDPEKRKRWVANYHKTPKRRWYCLAKSAKDRSLELKITKNEFLAKCESGQLSVCYYCSGENITLGLDRVDNTKGYLWNNVVPCCMTCNWMKRKSTQDEFFNHIEKIYLNRIKLSNFQSKNGGE